MPVMVGSRVFIVDGAFKGMEGVVRSVDGGQLTVEVEMFGRATPVPLREDQVQTAELDPRDGWRAQLAADSALGLRWELNAWWIARLGEPENDRVGEWAAFEPFQEQARQATAARLAALLADFDATFTDAAFQAQGHSGPTALWTAQAARWNASPAAAVADIAARRQVIRELIELRYSPDPEDNARYEREKDAVRRRDDEATARRERAAYAHRQHLAGPAGRSAPARVVVDEDEEPLRRLVRRTHGLVLPDHVFTFGAFWRGLTPEQSEAMCRCGGGVPPAVPPVPRTGPVTGGDRRRAGCLGAALGAVATAPGHRRRPPGHRGQRRRGPGLGGGGAAGHGRRPARGRPGARP